MRYLCTAASAGEVRDVMNEMSCVVQAMLKRLRVDLLQDEVAVALQAFDLQAWESPNNRAHLKSWFKKLCNILHADFQQVMPLLEASVAILLPLIARAKQHKFIVDNRVCWSWLLHSSWRARYAAKLKWSSECSFLIQFYLSLKMNTTTLERDLGQLLMQLDAHCGPLSPTGCLMASIMEVNSEGPQTEASFFKPGEDGGPLEPTSFARLCAKLWLQHFGRRFRYSYKTKRQQDKVQSPKSKAKISKPGTLAAFARGRTLATSKIVSAASKPACIVPGLTLPLPKPSSLEGTRWAPPTVSAASKSLSKFNVHTQRKQQRNMLV